MPCYLWICERCDQAETVWGTYAQSADAPLCTNHGPMVRDYTAEHRGHIPGGVYPFVTKNLDPSGKPIEVRDANHMKQLCKQFGVRNRDDAGYEEDTSYVDRNGRWKINDGNGRGMPRSWY